MSEGKFALYCILVIILIVVLFSGNPDITDGLRIIVLKHAGIYEGE